VISDGLCEEMCCDEMVFCFGEDIGVFGGVFKVIDGFIEEFGVDCVFDMLLVENMIIGVLIGVVIEGMKFVCEM